MYAIRGDALDPNLNQLSEVGAQKNARARTSWGLALTSQWFISSFNVEINMEING